MSIAAALGAGAVGCSDSGDDSGSALQESSARWNLSPDARAAGSSVRINYENAPYWNGGRACTGGLRTGSKALGTELMDRFAQVKSIGGYACRQNTADGSRLSVHGTGKALDVFIPVRGGRADSALGDPVANWLVMNAADIGIQLIIWNRSVWRANGDNEKPYSGPVPHIDHIHVELTEKAAREQTPWFLHVGGDVDGGVVTEDAALPAPIAHDASTGGGHDAAVSADAAVAVDAATSPPSPPPPSPLAHDAGALAPADLETDYDPDDSLPGEQDSLGTGIREVPVSSDDPAPPPIAGCATASARANDPTSAPASLGLVLAVAAFIRRRKR